MSTERQTNWLFQAYKKCQRWNAETNCMNSWGGDMMVRVAIIQLFHCSPYTARGLVEHLKIWFFLYFDYFELSPLLRGRLSKNTLKWIYPFLYFIFENWHFRNRQNKYLLPIPFFYPPPPTTYTHCKHRDCLDIISNREMKGKVK